MTALICRIVRVKNITTNNTQFDPLRSAGETLSCRTPRRVCRKIDQRLEYAEKSEGFQETSRKQMRQLQSRGGLFCEFREQLTVCEFQV